MSESKKDLLPCPFCGDGNARLEEGDYGQMVSCHPRSGCGAVTGYYETETEAAEAWNRRALADTQPAHGSVHQAQAVASEPEAADGEDLHGRYVDALAEIVRLRLRLGDDPHTPITGGRP